jgi:hypothetical protein
MKKYPSRGGARWKRQYRRRKAAYVRRRFQSLQTREARNRQCGLSGRRRRRISLTASSANSGDGSYGAMALGIWVRIAEEGEVGMQIRKMKSELFDTIKT